MSFDKNAILVLYSGGLDSTIILMEEALQINHTVSALTFYYHQRNMREIAVAQEIAAKLEIPHKLIDLSFMQSIGFGGIMENGEINNDIPISPFFLPYRNMLFCTIAAMYAYKQGISNIAVGFVKNRRNKEWVETPDTTNDFRVHLNKLLMGSIGEQTVLNDKPFIYAPLGAYYKSDIIKRAKDLTENKPEWWELIGKTHTCYYNEERACGKCEACISRQLAFNEAGIEIQH